jgi:hypothetical protein
MGPAAFGELIMKLALLATGRMAGWFEVSQKLRIRNQSRSIKQ